MFVKVLECHFDVLVCAFILVIPYKQAVRDLKKISKNKTSFPGKLVSIKGTVVRVGSIKPLCTRLAFTCLGCGTIHGVTQTEGRYTVPSLCPVQNCRSRSFVPDRSHKLTHTVDWQSFRLQEIISDDQVRVKVDVGGHYYNEYHLGVKLLSIYI